MKVRDFKRITKERIVWVDANGNKKRSEPDDTNYHVTHFRVDYERKCIVATVEHINFLIM